MIKYIFTLITCISFCLSVKAQRDTIRIDKEWQFRIDKQAEGMKANWFSKPLSNSRKVQLPHTWNVEKENENHYGWGWYQRSINVPANWKNKKLVLVFGAINHTSHIYLNGKKVFDNIGDGFNKFSVSLNGKVNYGQENIITVAVNNDYGRNKVPYGSSFDWANDGGLIRSVYAIVSDKPAANYIHAEPVLKLADSSARLKIKLGFDDKANKNIRMEVAITEENQATGKVIFKTRSKPVWENGEAVLDYSLPRVNPWHFDHPNLYRIDVKVLNGSKAVDRLSTTVGFREIKFDKAQLHLNGEHIKVMGVEWTAGSNPHYGFAEPAAEIIRHGKLMKDVNAIFSRQHFQQDDLFYDFCDRNGIIVQQEIPLWGSETPSNDTIRSIAMKQLERMVSNMYNHPSIFSWGVGNELRGRDKNMKQMIDDLLKKSRKLDPGRMTGYVSNTLTDSYYNNKNFTPDAAAAGDYLMMNEYGGSWWDIPTGKIHSYLDSVHLSYPQMPFFISEFGLCEPNFKGGDQRRIEDLIYHMAVYESKPYVEGAIYFDLTDYRTHYPGTPEENKYRRRVHGIYDMYGKPKPSMQVLRELSSPVEVQQLRQWKKGKANILIFGSIGLPQHSVKGYKLFLSDKTDNYASTRAYELPGIEPGQRLNFEVDDIYKGGGIVTIVRPTGFIASQKSFYWKEADQ